MTTAAVGSELGGEAGGVVVMSPPPRMGILAQSLRNRRVVVGGGVLLFIMMLCVVTLFWTLYATRTKQADGSVSYGGPFYTLQNDKLARTPPALWPPAAWFGYDTLGRSVLARSLFGGTISLAVGLAAATISVVLGVVVGLFAGYRGGWVDSALMRTVDILYGLPYVLLVILFKVAFEKPLVDGITVKTIWELLVLLIGLVMWAYVNRHSPGWWRVPWAIVPLIVIIGAGLNLSIWRETVPASGVAFKLDPQTANLVVLFSAIGLVSWLTMARVVRGQVLSLRGQPFIEACRALGVREGRIFVKHILPNLVGPITVYATLTVPSAILQESFLSFLGVGVNPPLATWGSLASEGVEQLSPLKFYWWLLIFPCTLLAVTLLSLNFLGDGLRDVFDPKKESAKI